MIAGTAGNQYRRGVRASSGCSHQESFVVSSMSYFRHAGCTESACETPSKRAASLMIVTGAHEQRLVAISSRLSGSRGLPSAGRTSVAACCSSSSRSRGGDRRLSSDRMAARLHAVLQFAHVPAPAPGDSQRAQPRRRLKRIFPWSIWMFGQTCALGDQQDIAAAGLAMPVAPRALISPIRDSRDLL